MNHLIALQQQNIQIFTKHTNRQPKTNDAYFET